MQLEFQYHMDHQITPLNQNHDQLAIAKFQSPLHMLLKKHILLFQLLNRQNKWQLWLSAKPMLKRSWFKQSELDEHKVVQMTNIDESTLVDTIEKALLSQSFSYISACISSLNKEEKLRLQVASQSSGTSLFLVSEDYIEYVDFMMLSDRVYSLH